MSVMTQQLLQPDTGASLPGPVRLALIDMGVACNSAANVVNYAFTQQVQTLTALEARRALRQSVGLTTSVAEDLARCADRYHADAVAVFARAATTYAVYAAQVASDVASGTTPSVPGSQVIRPSDLLTALDLYLPNVQFPVQLGEPKVVREQNDDIKKVRETLVNIITHQLEGEQLSSYDGLQESAPSRSTTPDLVVGFPDALHTYAATLVWAVGVFTGVVDDVGGAGVTGAP